MGAPPEGEGSSECIDEKVSGSVCVTVPSRKPAPPNRLLLIAQVLLPNRFRYGSRLEAGTRKDSVSPFSLTSHLLICAPGNSGIFGVETMKDVDRLEPTSTAPASMPLSISVYRNDSPDAGVGIVAPALIVTPALMPP